MVRLRGVKGLMMRGKQVLMMMVRRVQHRARSVQVVRGKEGRWRREPHCDHGEQTTGVVRASCRFRSRRGSNVISLAF